MSEPNLHPYLDSESESELLATAFVPDKRAAHGLLSAIAEQDDALGHMDEETSRFEARELRASRVSLADLESRDVNKSFLAPTGIRKMPVEILGMIFVQLSNVLDERSRSIINSTSPLILMHVCRRWRQIAAKTPRLWTMLNFIDSPEELEEENDWLSLVDMWLSNSGTLLIDIHLHQYGQYGEYNPAVTQAVIRNIHRFHSIKSCAWDEFLFVISSQMLPISAPSLQCLEIHDPHSQRRSYNGEHLRLDQVPKCSIHAPSLTEISLPSPELMALFDSPLSNLHRLSLQIYHGSSISLLDNLRTCSSLTCLEIIFQRTTPILDHNPPLLLPSLRTLKLGRAWSHDTNTGFISPFLRFIQAPALQSLSIDSLLTEDTFDSFIFFLGENPPLQRFFLRHSRKEDELSLISFLSKLACLRTLLLGYCEVTGAALQALTPDPSSASISSSMCPRLSSLFMDNCYLPADPLITLVHNRVPVEGSDSGLSRVGLFFCTDTSGCPGHLQELGRLDVQERMPINGLMKIDVLDEIPRGVIDEHTRFLEHGEVEWE